MRLAGAACCIGMGDNETLGSCLATGASVIKIIKPYADREEIFSRIRFAEEHGAVAVGMDVEHSIRADSPEPDGVTGLDMRLPSLEELKSAAKLFCLCVKIVSLEKLQREA